MGHNGNFNVKLVKINQNKMAILHQIVVIIDHNLTHDTF